MPKKMWNLVSCIIKFPLFFISSFYDEGILVVFFPEKTNPPGRTTHTNVNQGGELNTRPWESELKSCATDPTPGWV